MRRTRLPRPPSGARRRAIPTVGNRITSANGGNVGGGGGGCDGGGGATEVTASAASVTRDYCVYSARAEARVRLLCVRDQISFL